MDDFLFIHVPDIKKYKSIVKKIIYNYNYDISHFCCGGDGCKLKKLVKI